MSTGVTPRIGITILPEHRWADAAPMWRDADAMGFDHGWVYDHLSWRTLADGPWFGTMPTLMGAALVTSRMRLGTFVASPNFRHPVAWIREVASVQDASDGRLVLGIGAGGPTENGVLGDEPLTPRQRADRYEEFTELLDRLLAQDHVTYDGRYYRAHDARTLPLLDPRPPLVVAANGPRGMRLAAAHGQGWATTGPMDADGDPSWWRGLADIAARAGEVLPDGADRYLQLDAGPRFSLESVEHFADCVGRAGELGFTDVVTHWPRPDGVYAGDPSILADALARAR